MKFGFGLPGETYNHIAGHLYMGAGMFQGGHLLQVLVPRVPPVHPGKHCIAARLGGKVDVAAYLGQFRKTADQFRRYIFRVGRGEANPLDSIHSSHSCQQTGESKLLFFLQSVRIDVLPQQGYLFDSLARHSRYLPEYLAGGAADFAPADMGHDAVGAEIVAPLHDGNEPGDATGRIIEGEEIRPGFPIEKIDLNRTAPLFGSLDHFRQQVQVVGAEYEIKVGHLFQEPFPFLLGDAAADRQDKPAVSLLQPLEPCQVVVDLLLRLRPDAARIENDEVGAGGIFNG